MIKDVDFSAPDKASALKLVELCRAEGWRVDDDADVHHYEKGVPVLNSGDDPDDAYVPEETHSSVYAHAPLENIDDNETVYARADELAAQAGAKVVGGGIDFAGNL